MTLQTKLIIVGVILASLYGGHKYLVHEAVNETKAEMLAEYNKQVLNSVLATIDTENKLREESKKLLESKDAKIKSVNSELLRLNRLLSDRPSRPNDSINSVPGPSCTGRELYKEDGQFLAGEAARAEELIVERDYYYSQYISVYNLLEKMRKNDKNSIK